MIDEKNWCVYILQCRDETYYIGITNDLPKRLQAHGQGKGAKYTSGRLPVKMVYRHEGLTESGARKEEFVLKKWKRSEKVKLINGLIVR